MSGTPFNDLQFPTDIVLLAVLWRLRYKLGFGDFAELLLQRGFEVNYKTYECGSPVTTTTTISLVFPNRPESF